MELSAAPKSPRTPWRLAMILSALLLLPLTFLVPCIPMFPPGPEEVQEWGVVSGGVQVNLTVAQWLQLVWRHHGTQQP